MDMGNTKSAGMFLLISNIPLIAVIIAYFIYGYKILSVLFTPVMEVIFVGTWLLFWYIGYLLYGKYLSDMELLLL